MKLRGKVVSVPFTRGTPPWPWQPVTGSSTIVRFSPLHEGDTSVAGGSAWHQAARKKVSVPFTRGTPPWRSFWVARNWSR